MSIPEQQIFSFTDKQGQYLAYIHHYTKLNGMPPAHIDFQKFFKVTSPSLNQMGVDLLNRQKIYFISVGCRIF